MRGLTQPPGSISDPTSRACPAVDFECTVLRVHRDLGDGPFQIRDEQGALAANILYRRLSIAENFAARCQSHLDVSRARKHYRAAHGVIAKIVQDTRIDFQF